MSCFLPRRVFIKRTSKLIAGVTILPSVGYNFDFVPNDFSARRVTSRRKYSYSPVNYEFGVEGSVPKTAEELDIFMKAVKDLGAEFIVCQFSPKLPVSKTKGSWEGTAQGFKEFAAACKKYNLSFFANQEVTNYSTEGEILDAYGIDILAHPDKTHRWDITGDLLETVSKIPEFKGVLYDEAEHGQMRRKLNTNNKGQGSGRVHPYFAITDHLTLEEAYNAVFHSAKKVAEGYRKKNISPMTENVFPVMLFIFARAGFDVAVKFMKESIDPVYAAIALGAAKQYGTEFCVSPDMWGFDWTLNDHFPGHQPEELRASLLYAYWIGASRIFVENIRGMIEKKSENGVARYEPTEYGKIYRWFVKEYVPSHPRPYDFRDIKPEIAIIHFDDTDWGQKDSRFTDNLYGAVNLHSIPETEAWFKIWKLLTHDQTHEGALSFNSKKYKEFPHNFFYPLKGVIVYDHLVTYKELKCLKLIFLTGVLISPQTLKAVRSFVRKGGLCISLTSLAPADLAGKTGLISDGSGNWLLVNDFLSDEVRKSVLPFLGKPDEISYCFGKFKLIIKLGKDRNSINISVQNEADSEKSDQA